MRLNTGRANSRLSGEQVGAFQDALLDAFSTRDALSQMLGIYVERQLDHIALGDNLRQVAYKVIAQAEDDSWTAALLAGARTAKPSNDALLTFGQQFGLAPATPASGALERTIRDANGTLDVVPWRTRMGAIEGQVCRVEVQSSVPPDFGTGFLLGPDVLLTNYHVLEAVISGQVPPLKVSLRFDYKMLAKGPTVNGGTVYRLAEPKWLLDESPYSAHDLKDDEDGNPTPLELDYALVRVKGAPGNDPVGGPGVRGPHSEPRGWIDIPATTHDFMALPSVFIMQHPEGGPLKLAFDTQSVIGVNANNSRVRYKTTTEPGSSGSPCFDANWNLIAMHHSGDPRYEKLRRAEYNQGVPIAAIVALLEARKKRGLLGDPHP
jgi:hypothetical protein